MAELSDWDLDFSFGQAGENTVAKLLSDPTVEVKTDRKWINTGNIYIETECWNVTEQRWKPSGIAVSKATHWAFNLEGNIIIVERKVLVKALWDTQNGITCDIPPNPSRGFLIKVSHLLRAIGCTANL